MLGNLSTCVKTEIHVHTCMHIILIKNNYEIRTYGYKRNKTVCMNSRQEYASLPRVHITLFYYVLLV